MTPGRFLALRDRSLKTVQGLLLAALTSALLGALAWAPPAFAATPWWQITSEVTPSYLPPGGDGEIIVVASNLGDEPINEGKSPVVISDQLPGGLTAVAISMSGGECSLASAQCTYTRAVNPYERLTVAIKVKVEEPPGSVTALPNKVSVEGGGAPRAATSTQQLTVNSQETPFGVQNYDLAPFNENGTPDTQAGSHPFELTTTLVMNQTGRAIARIPVGLPKDVRFRLPPGLVGNTAESVVAQCTMADFSAFVVETNLCPPGSVVGVAAVTVKEPLLNLLFTKTVPVFNLVPAQGEPARFGFEVIGKIPVVIDTAVRSGSDYGVVASVKNATETGGLLSSQVTLWGVPGDPRHNQSRGWECIAGGAFQKEIGNKPCPNPSSSELSQEPFLTLPTSCPANPAVEPLTSSTEADSWAHPGSFVTAEYSWLSDGGEQLGLAGCSELPFTPTITVSPETTTATTPTGFSVDVKVAQGPTLEANPEGRAEADVSEAVVTMPSGVQVNPSAANGLEDCPENGTEVAPGVISAGIGFTGFEEFQPGSPAATFTEGFDFTPPNEPKPGESFCPEASKVGLVHIKTPLLPQELEGAVYLAEPAPNGEAKKNPFNSLIALYIVAEDKQAGVLVKLAGEGKLDPTTGQITTTFKNTPQLPFEELKLELFGGDRASLSTPAECGSYQATSSFTAWSGAVAEPASSFEIASGAGGGLCPSGALPFSPSFEAQSTSTQAGAFSQFDLEIGRPDGQQALSGVTVTLPPGIAALLSSVTPCREPPAGREWSCGSESLVGHSSASSGLGNEPIALPGDAYLTTGYDGAPFGILVRTKAEAGPFDLGYVNVRSRINVNPETAAVTITTDPGPHGDALITMLKGIPVQLKRLVVSVDRPNFEFNPTNCNPMSITGTLDGSEGASVGVFSRFQVGGCEQLPFHPVLTAAVGGHASKADGASFDVNVQGQGLGVANVRKVELQLPAQLPSRLSTLNKACLATTFEANPASCPPESVIGMASVHTPVLKSPLSGPAYLVSHGNAAFPDVEFVLQGEGIMLVLDGHTDIKKGITYSRFESAPDAPFTSFEADLPAGPHGILGAYVSEKEPYELCHGKLEMPTTITAQDGAVIEQDTPITPTGCGGVLAAKTKLTKAQLLAKALAACRKKYKHNRRRRAGCEKAAHARYAPKTARKTPRTTHHRG